MKDLKKEKNTRTILVYLNKENFEYVDRICKTLGMTRSGFVNVMIGIQVRGEKETVAGLFESTIKEVQSAMKKKK